MSKYYDRAGEPIEMMDWAHRFEDFDYKQVAQDDVGDVRVSTVWLGLDHNFGDGPPLIFDTMIFGGQRDEDCFRYPTEEEALAGHARVCAEISEGESVDP